MVLHLLDELARELDRLHVRAEGSAEDALEQASILCSMFRRTLIAPGYAPLLNSNPGP